MGNEILILNIFSCIISNLQNPSKKKILKKGINMEVAQGSNDQGKWEGVKRGNRKS